MTVDPTERLRRLLQNLEDLDLTYKIQISHRHCCGGCADIFIGVMSDGITRVAIKRGRFSDSGDMLVFTKVWS